VLACGQNDPEIRRDTVDRVQEQHLDRLSDEPPLAVGAEVCGLAPPGDELPVRAQQPKALSPPLAPLAGPRVVNSL
jgi:hypothetical protein